MCNLTFFRDANAEPLGGCSSLKIMFQAILRWSSGAGISGTGLDVCSRGGLKACLTTYITSGVSMCINRQPGMESYSGNKSLQDRPPRGSNSLFSLSFSSLFAKSEFGYFQLSLHQFELLGNGDGGLCRVGRWR